MSEYVSRAAFAIYKSEQNQEEFKKHCCHYIKHHTKGASKLVETLETIASSKSRKEDKSALRIVIEKLKNQRERINCKKERLAGRPIGSGITESACKMLIKARMHQSWNALENGRSRQYYCCSSSSEILWPSETILEKDYAKRGVPEVNWKFSKMIS
jgi:hypothetical protein